MTLSLNRACRFLTLALWVGATAACGGSTPPPKTEDSAKTDSSTQPSGRPSGPAVEQELGSIDERAVAQTFDKLQVKLETCHKQGRDRLDYLAGDMKVFMRIGKDGRVKYVFFDESTIGDRDTEKCILEMFAATDWPKPQGGEAEVKNGFGWSPGGERQPTPWGPEKVMTALEDDKQTKSAVEKCKSGVSGDFRVTAYVEPAELENHHESGHGAGKSNGKGPPAKSGGKKKKSNGAGGEHGGKFKSLGVAPPGKDGAERVDCIVDALKNLPLPSPGSYVAKVTFAL